MTMQRKSNGVAWGLAAVLAVVLLTGIGVMLTRGISLGDVDAQVSLTDGWTTGTVTGGCNFGWASSVSRIYDIGFFAVEIRRVYSYRQAPHKQATPAGPPASTPSSTVRS